MADRFPSLDEIDAGQTEARGEPTIDGIETNDSSSDFLARERAVLGDDANLFDTADGGNATSAVSGDIDLLEGSGHEQHVQHTSAVTPGAAGTTGAFESNFPAIDTQNEQVAPGGSITGTSLPYQPDKSSAPQEESQAIREWRERRDLAIQHRDQVSADKKLETVKAAQQAIDEFYENYNNKKDKTAAQTKKEAEDFLKNREDTTSGGTSWERIAKLVDLSGKGTTGGAEGSDKAKFRELLLSLRKDDKAPGASGV